MQSLARLPAVALLACALPACPSDDEAEPDPKCAEAVDHSDLAWIQENIFTPSCSRFNACHKGRALDAAELSLETEETHAQLVNVQSTLFEDWKRVVPGDPEHSYLMVILGHYDGPLTEKGTMPYNSPLLCAEKRDAIQRWIEAGAPAE